MHYENGGVAVVYIKKSSNLLAKFRNRGIGIDSDIRYSQIQFVFDPFMLDFNLFRVRFLFEFLNI